MSDYRPISDLTRRVPPLHDEEPPSAPDTAATQEAQGFASGNLEQVSAENEHRRSEAFKDHVHRLAICGTWAFGILYLVGGLIVVWHNFTPPTWAWLPPDQLHTVTAVVFSGAISSAGTRYFSRRIS